MIRMMWAFVVMGWSMTSAALQVAVPADVQGDYQRWLKGRDVLTLRDFSGPGVRRDVVEVALFEQALAVGCAGESIDWVMVDSYPRTLSLLREGRLDAAATSLWLSDLQSAGLSHSTAVIDDGQFVAALYAREKEMLSINVSELPALRAVSSTHWAKDWAVLQQLPFAALYSVNDWPTMVRWVASDKADVLLAPMVAGDPVTISVEDVTLVPVPGMRIVLSGSRHFGFSVGCAMSACFDQGLQQLQRQGIVRHAYEDAGFWRADFMRWPIVSP